MLLDNSSDLIVHHHRDHLADGRVVDMAQLINGQFLAISQDALALYRSAEAIHDPLGNGLLASIAIPSEHHLQQEQGGYLQRHKAGYVGLSHDMTLLITLNDVQLFASRQDALRNQNEIVRLSLAG